MEVKPLVFNRRIDMQNMLANFAAPGFLGSYNTTWRDMRNGVIRVRQGKRLALNKAATRAARNNVKRETARAVKEALF
jgi:hypothetical protein